MINIEELANEAEVIIDGFAFVRFENGIRIFDLNNKKGVAVISKDGKLVETNMDDIELKIAQKYLNRAEKYMEVDNA